MTLVLGPAGALVFQVQRMARHGLWLNVGMILGGLVLSSAMVRLPPDLRPELSSLILGSMIAETTDITCPASSDSAISCSHPDRTLTAALCSA